MCCASIQRHVLSQGVKYRRGRARPATPVAPLVTTLTKILDNNKELISLFDKQYSWFESNISTIINVIDNICLIHDDFSIFGFAMSLQQMSVLQKVFDIMVTVENEVFNV